MLVDQITFELALHATAEETVLYPAWLELDTEAWRATFHRIAYDVDRAADAIVAADLPEHLARRLYVGQ